MPCTTEPPLPPAPAARAPQPSLGSLSSLLQPSRHFAPTVAVTVTAGISHHRRQCPHLSAVSPSSVLRCPGFIFFSGATLVFFQSIAMVHTRGGSRLRPRVRFSTPEREEQAPVPAPVPAPIPASVPEAVPEEPQGFRRYQTRMGPRAPSPVPRRRSRRARPSKRARTSGPSESSSSRPQPSPVTSAAEATSSPQLSPASRIRRPLFVGNPIPGNVRLHRREFHQESYYDVPALMADPRFRDSMRLIEHYSLLPFMRPR